MPAKCCQRKPRCKNCPKRKKNKAIVTVDREIAPIFYIAPLADISINGQRG
jgi:tRNA(Ile2) C34 agmatinyltransferase TiaS